MVKHTKSALQLYYCNRDANQLGAAELLSSAIGRGVVIDRNVAEKAKV